MAALRIVASRVAGAPAIRLLFAEHGYEFLAGTFVPVAELDAREAQFLPATSASELGLATKRLVDADDSGAITKACGAVDLMTADLYVRYGLGDPAHAAFAAKVMTAAKRLQIFENLESDITSLGLKPADAQEIAAELRQSTNHAAQALQVLRRSMGDVHGTKPALRRAAYDAVKWASAICGLFEGQ